MRSTAAPSGRSTGSSRRGPGSGWYSTGPPGRRLRGAARDRSTLVAYFAARHERGERLRLRSFRFNGNADDGRGRDAYGNFEYGLIRSADDLAPARYYGKGAARCREGRSAIWVWSMAPQ